MNQDHLKLLGYSVRDRVSGFTGIVTSISFDISGCVQGYVDAPATKNVRSKEGGWYDTKRLVPLGKRPVMPPPTFENVPGGQDLPAPDAKQAPRPT